MRGALDEADVERVFAMLMTLGLAEERADGVRSTRSWNLALQRAADRLNRRVAETGTIPSGNPIVLAVEDALAAEKIDLPSEERALAVHLLVLLEVVNMPPHKREEFGYGDVRG